MVHTYNIVPAKLHTYISTYIKLLFKVISRPFLQNDRHKTCIISETATGTTTKFGTNDTGP